MSQARKPSPTRGLMPGISSSSLVNIIDIHNMLVKYDYTPLCREVRNSVSPPAPLCLATQSSVAWPRHKTLVTLPATKLRA